MDKTSEKDRINEMIAKIMQVARGDYSVQVELLGENDEIDSLAVGVNMMIEDIRERVKEVGKNQELLKEKIKREQEFPLMSVRDARILVICEMFGTKEHYNKRLEQMKIRHEKRQKDIDRYYRYDELWE